MISKDKVVYNLEEWKNVEQESVVYECIRDVFFIKGEKSKQWCNGIFTNNIRSLHPPLFKYNAYCNDRGHVQGLASLLCVEEDSFLCILESPSLDVFLQRFSMFMILDDIESIPQNTKIFSLQGSQNEKYFGLISEELDVSYPQKDRYSYNSAKSIFCIPHDRTGFGGIDIIATTEKAHALVKEIFIRHNIHIGNPQTLESLRISANKVDLQKDSTERSFVHELRINESCCAFDKGCYVGQEIINRMDVKGILNKRLTRVLLEDDIDIPCDVFLETSQKKTIGIITSKAHTPHGILGLGILRKTAWQHQQQVFLTSSNQTTVGRVYDPES
jgi:folate-binding protein YgfZ